MKSPGGGVSIQGCLLCGGATWILGQNSTLLPASLFLHCGVRHYTSTACCRCCGCCLACPDATMQQPP
jgi:hypothetical protein